MKTVRIDKMRSGHSQILSLLVHHIHKLFHGTSDMPCDRHTCVIGGIYHQRIKQLVHRHLISRLHSAQHGALFQVHILRLYGDHILHISVFDRQKGCHDLCDAGRIDLVIDSLGVEDLPAVQLEQSRLLPFRKGDISQRDIRLAHTQFVRKRWRKNGRRLFQRVAGQVLIGLITVGKIHGPAVNKISDPENDRQNDHQRGSHSDQKIQDLVCFCYSIV